jgi:hypothetical protein
MIQQFLMRPDLSGSNQAENLFLSGVLGHVTYAPRLHILCIGA